MNIDQLMKDAYVHPYGSCRPRPPETQVPRHRPLSPAAVRADKTVVESMEATLSTAWQLAILPFVLVIVGLQVAYLRVRKLNGAWLRDAATRYDKMINRLHYKYKWLTPVLLIFYILCGIGVVVVAIVTI